MKTVLLTGLVLIFSLALSAQNIDKICPTISVDGPLGIVKPGDIGTYTARIDLKGLAITPQLKWSINAGTIVSGQGTQMVEVRNSTNWNTTVTVEIEGFPAGCPNSVSETAIVDITPLPIKLSTMKGRLDKVSFTDIIDAAAKDPNAQIYIFVSGPAKNTARSIERKMNLITKGLNRLQEDRRITFVTLTIKDDTAVFWLVPQGSNNPTP